MSVSPAKKMAPVARPAPERASPRPKSNVKRGSAAIQSRPLVSTPRVRGRTATLDHRPDVNVSPKLPSNFAKPPGKSDAASARIPFKNPDKTTMEHSDRERLVASHGFGAITTLGGNLAVQRLLTTSNIQAKLSVSQPSDADELEADRVADAITIAPSVAKADRTSAGGAGRLAPSMPGQAKPRSEQAKPSSAPPENLGLVSGGQPLPPAVREYFEAQFAYDFRDVRIHADSQAAESARAIQARAYTTGQHVVFGHGEFAPTTQEGRKLLAHELTHVIQQKNGGTQATPKLARAVDPSKAAPIKKELDSFFPSNSTLEELWASLGLDLPDAINDKIYRDLWWRSVLDEEISLTNAGRPLIQAFANDTVALAKNYLSSQVTRLENLQDELKRATEQNKTSAPPTQSSTGGIEDPKKNVSRSTVPKPIADARALVDTATVVHFLRNWEDILKAAPVGERRVDTSNLLRPPGQPAAAKPFDPFPSSPSSPNNSGTGAPAVQSVGSGIVPILFDPNVAVETLLNAPNVEFIDREAASALQKAYRECGEQRTMFRQLEQALLEEDANLAVLAERGLLAQVSALSAHSDDHASSAIVIAAKENAAAAKRFLDMINTPGKVEWNALRPVYSHLLAGGAGGRRDWSNITVRGFIDDYFKKVAEAERDRARAELIMQLAIGAATFIALLTPAAPLAALFVVGADAFAVAGAVMQSNAADKKAEVLSAGADAQVVNKDDARRAKEDADSKNTSMVLSILTSALPYLPAVARGGVKAASALGRELRWEQIAGGAMSKLGAGPAALPDLLVDLSKAGISAIARNRAGGTLSLNYMVGRIQAMNRSLGFTRVTAALLRGGDELLLNLGSKYKLSDYIRYHMHGPGTGVERYPIFLAPTKANQFANNHIEGFMRRHRDAGATVEFSVSYATFAGDELRPFIEGMLRSGDKDVISRLALDQGLIEKFLKSATYDIRVVPAGSTSSQLYRAHVTIGAPPTGVFTGQLPVLIP